MNCRHAQHLLDGYLDGELPPSLRAELHAHRLTCSECQRAMAIVEAATDVIASDPMPRPALSTGFTDRTMLALKPPPEPRVQRIIRLRRAAAFLGPALSAAAVWMLVVSALDPIESTISSPRTTQGAKLAVKPEPQTKALIVSADAPSRSATIVDALAEGLLAPAQTAWQDTQRSTRDLLTVGRWLFRPTGEGYAAQTADATEESESGVLLQAESMLMKMLAPEDRGDGVTEGPDIL